MVRETLPWCDPGKSRGNWIIPLHQGERREPMARLMAQTWFSESSRPRILCTFNHTWVWKQSGNCLGQRLQRHKPSQRLEHPGAVMELSPPSPACCALCCPESAAGLKEPHFPQGSVSNPAFISRGVQRRLNGLGVLLSHCTVEISIWIWAAVQAEDFTEWSQR